MENTRRHRRYTVDSTEISGTIILASYVKINDISLGGLSLNTEKRLISGSRYTLRIKGKDEILMVSGTVAWSLLSESIKDSSGNVIPIYKTGIEFIDLSSEKEQEIMRFIETHEKAIDKKIDVHSLSGKRLHVRFQVKETEKATVWSQDEHKVKNISLSGLLIDSEDAFKIEDKINMQMTLPGNKIISFLGRVVTCRTLKYLESQNYEIGIEFVHMSPKDQEVLRNFISSLNDIE
jgi:c-di-GMP-binding flagellar brake protein YcgR